VKIAAFLAAVTIGLSFAIGMIADRYGPRVADRFQVRGGAGRTRTSNQTVMSAVTLSEASIKSDPFRHTNQQMFTIGCGQSLAKRWLASQ
jgi:hypothetical protein